MQKSRKGTPDLRLDSLIREGNGSWEEVVQRQPLNTSHMKIDIQLDRIIPNLEENPNSLSVVVAQKVQASSLGTAVLSVLPLSFSHAHPGGQAERAPENHDHVIALHHIRMKHRCTTHTQSKIQITAS